MLKKLILILTLLAIVSSSPVKNWALLAAGSCGWSNYRHQSDLFHAYKILIKNGIPKENIITMACDDIAHNKKNPVKGKVCNYPNGPNVYQGVQIDYQDVNVSASNFLAVLAGNKSAVKGGNGRVIESTNEDNIFVYFTDHGADNVILFPEGDVYAKDLNKTLNEMFVNKRYNRLLFYLESCYSGTMFRHFLKPNINVYATTAANYNESSYAYYCGTKANCGGKRMGTCLGDEYSIHWLEHTEKYDIWDYLIRDQFEQVKNKTKQSEVQQYGYEQIAIDFIGMYLGHREQGWNHFLNFINFDDIKNQFEKDDNIRINNNDYYLYYLKENAEINNDKESWDKYKNEIQLAARSKNIFDEFKKEFKLPENRLDVIVDNDCLKMSLDWYKKLCGFNVERDTKYITLIASFCTMKYNPWKAYHFFSSICFNL